jgi:hypothetical protein
VHNGQITENPLTKQKKGSEISGLIICVVLLDFLAAKGVEGVRQQPVVCDLYSLSR